MNKSYKSQYSKQYEFIVNNNEQTDSLVGTGFTVDYTQAYSYLRLGGNIYNVDSDKLHEYVKNISNAMKHKDYNKPKINSFSRKLKYMIACILKKVPLNPLSCETEILDRLIICFAEKNTDIDKYSRYWKNVIY
jgi:hypothetical protein